MHSPLFALLLALFLTGCTVNNVSSDYDPNVLLASMTRYAWAPTPSATAGFPSLDQQRLRVAVDAALTRKAMQPVPTADAALWVQTGIDLRQVRDVSTMEMGSAFNHPILIGGETLVHVHQYTEAVIYVEFVAPKDTRVVWRGQLTRPWSEKTTPAKREQILRDAVAEILVSFPPLP